MIGLSRSRLLASLLYLVLRYTYLPHAGAHPRAALRKALGTYRNVIESTFSSLKEMGLAGTDQNRPSWAGDDQMDHLVWMAVTNLTARRLVHANGLYDQVWAQADRDRLLTAPTVTDMTPGPKSLSPAEAAALNRGLKRYAQAPAGWPTLDPDTDEFHGDAIEANAVSEDEDYDGYGDAVVSGTMGV